MAGIALRPFIDLLPYRLYHALAGRGLRARRVRRQREEAVRAPDGTTGDCRRLYIDLAVISSDDGGTGIQRVVRALALALIEEASPSREVRFVAADRHSAYHVIAWPAGAAAVERETLRARPGDVFLGLDFSLEAVRRHRRQLARFRRDGGSLWFLVCDLLPVQRPEWFAPNNVTRYKAWLEVIAGISEGFLCISRQTESELQAELRERFDVSGGYRTRVVPMGHDIMESHAPSFQVTEGATTPDRFDMAAPFTLMVGTLEPRKGHADILAAFDELWRRGSKERLVLVGRMGWRVADLRARILDHPEYGGRLLWFDDVGDAELERIYRACRGMIIASHAEGFGLPLIEALGHRKPVLARDLAIFRQHEALGVRYFPAAAAPAQLADCIGDWMDDVQAGEIVITPPVADWKESARVILSAVEPVTRTGEASPAPLR
ncbi:MAG TPA: glycosyltransferase [Novosphingobium sp.]|nr:glycosyltransferase [Novosphingobium sp.]